MSDRAQSTSSKTLSRQRYGRYAAGYVTSSVHARGADLDRMLEVVAPEATWHALDVATGGGHTALKLAAQVERVTATDLTPEMLAAARAFVGSQGGDNVDFQLADAESLPFAAATFDLVTCRIAAHHFPRCDRFVRQAARVLKPGGRLWVQDHVLPVDDAAAHYVDAFEKLRDPSHHRAFQAAAWEAMLAEAGLLVEHSEKITKRHELLPWARRQGCTAEVIEELRRRLARAAGVAGEWLQAQALGTPEASFVNHHILIAGRKP